MVLFVKARIYDILHKTIHVANDFHGFEHPVITIQSKWIDLNARMGKGLATCSGRLLDFSRGGGWSSSSRVSTRDLASGLLLVRVMETSTAERY